jgi:hypothetical protein
MPRGPCRLLRSIFRLAYWKPTCSRLATLKDRRTCLSNSHCLKALLHSRKGCAMPPTLFLRRPNRDLFPGSGTFRSSPFSSGSSRGIGGSLRLGSDTTTPCSNCNVPNQLRLGWMRLSQKSKTFGGPATRIRQVLCTEYDVGVGIGWHRDKPHFDRIFGLSLGSACKFRFRKSAGKSWDRFTLDAEPRSLYMMSGASRRIWEHSIPAVEAPRYSITFRTMSNAPDPGT